jgi:hypothetical protein
MVGTGIAIRNVSAWVGLGRVIAARPVQCLVGFNPSLTTNQPLSPSNSVRALFEGGPAYHDLWQAVLWCIGSFVVFLVTSLNLYRNVTA